MNTVAAAIVDAHRPWYRSAVQALRNQLLAAPLGPLCRRLALPCLAGLLLMGGATFADAAIVAHFAGDVALAAILLAFPLTMVNSALAALLGSGAAARVSRLLGEGDDLGVERACGAFVVWTALGSFAVAAIGIAFAEPLLAALGARGPTLELGVQYLRIVFLASPALNFVFGVSFIVRAEGRVLDAMLLLAAGSALNIALDGLLIGLLDMGVRGAALATLGTALASSAATYGYLRYGRSALAVRRWRLGLAPKLLGPTLRDGLTAALTYIAGVVQQAIAFYLVTLHGSPDDLLFVGVYLRLIMFALVPVWAVAMAMQPVVGMSHGASQPDRTRRALWTFLGHATLAGLGAWVVAMLWPEQLLASLVQDPALIAAHSATLRLMLAAFPTLALQVVVAMFLVAVGKGLHAAAVLLARDLLFLLPLLALLTTLYGVRGVWLSFLGTDLLAFVSALWLLRVGLREVEAQRSPNDRIMSTAPS